jgi:hypothetical protein
MERALLRSTGNKADGGDSDIDIVMDTDGDDGTPSSGPGKKTSRSWKTLGGIFPTNLTEAELLAWMRGRSFRPIWIQYLDKWLIPNQVRGNPSFVTLRMIETEIQRDQINGTGRTLEFYTDRDGSLHLQWEA